MKFKVFTSLMIVAGFIAIILGCDKQGRCIKGSGSVVSQNIEMTQINGASLSIDANVFLTKGEPQSVRIEGQQNIINNIETYVSDGIWRIDYDRCVRKHSGVNIHITTPSINYLTISGSGNIESTNTFTDTTNVYLRISGSGNIGFGSVSHIIESEISGSGRIYLSGSAFENRIGISGSGNVSAFNLDTYDTYVSISGSGYSEVTVENLLNVNISGSGNVFYKGYPEINSNISGSGGVIDAN